MLRRADEGPASDRQAGGAVDRGVRERGRVQFALDLPRQPVPGPAQGRQDLAGVEVAGVAGALALDRRGSCLHGRRAELADAGFRDIEVRGIDAPLRLASAAECLRFERESFGALHQMLSGLPEAEREAAWAEVGEALTAFQGPGGFAGPCRLLVAAGTR